MIRFLNTLFWIATFVFLAFGLTIMGIGLFFLFFLWHWVIAIPVVAVAVMGASQYIKQQLEP